MMKKKEIETRIKGAFTSLAPDGFDAVLAEASSAGPQEIVFDAPKRRNGWVRWAACAAALVLVAAAVLGVGWYRTNYTVASTVALEVNPSLEIRVNRGETVLEVVPKNDDARTVIGDMDFRGSKLDVTVNALVGSMLRHGYLSEMANSILVSVDAGGAEGAALQEKLTREIDELFATGGFSGAVISQTVRDDSGLSALAEEYGITQGKAQLIDEIVAQDSRYTFESLSGLSINDLNLILKSKVGAAEEKSIAAAGTASDAGYIGRLAAQRAALEAAGVTMSDVTDGVWIGMDWEDGVMVYEVEFNAGNWGYECEVNATDGRVLKCERDEPHSVTVASGTDHGVEHYDEHHETVMAADFDEDAYRAALSDAGVAEADVVWKRSVLDRDDGRTVYEIEFWTKDCGYEYEIDAGTYAVLQCEKEIVAGAADDASGGAPNIGENEAKEIALRHAGVAEADALGMRVKLDRDDGRQQYEVEFISGSTEYEYEIDALTGAVLQYKTEFAQVDSGGGSVSEVIGEDAAKEIALGHAGVQASDAAGMRVKLDRDDGRQKYEVEFISGGVEYEYEIDALTGAVLKSERDRHD